MALTVAARKPMHDAHRVAESGAVDADGHILEPPTLWEDYIDPAFRDRALRIRLDENGLEELEIDGRRSRMSRRGFPATLGAMGAPDLADMQTNPARTYLGESPYGAMDPSERIDAVYSHTFIGERVPLRNKPSDYFRERVWISCDPDERTIPALAERFGAERFMWASDFPHADHTPEYVHDLNELVAMFPAADRRKFVGDNARALFQL